MDRSRKVWVDGRHTSLQLEAEYWSALDEIGRRETLGLHELCTFISRGRTCAPLAPAVRLFVIRYFRDVATDGVERRRARPAMAVPGRSPA